jgi:hypothetical protein
VSAKPLKGDPTFKGAGVMEVVDDYDGDTYRAVYTVRFEGVVYVLHCFPEEVEEMDRLRLGEGPLEPPRGGHREPREGQRG